MFKLLLKIDSISWREKKNIKIINRTITCSFDAVSTQITESYGCEGYSQLKI